MLRILFGEVDTRGSVESAIFSRSPGGGVGERDSIESFEESEKAGEGLLRLSPGGGDGERDNSDNPELSDIARVALRPRAVSRAPGILCVVEWWVNKQSKRETRSYPANRIPGTLYRRCGCEKAAFTLHFWNET